MIAGNGPGAAGHSATDLTTSKPNTPTVTNTGTALKRHRVLRALLAGPLTTFQAERAPTFDHCLPSSISELRKDGVDIVATRITVAGYGGHPARIAQYVLTDAGRHAAQRILACGT